MCSCAVSDCFLSLGLQHGARLVAVSRRWMAPHPPAPFPPDKPSRPGLAGAAAAVEEGGGEWGANTGSGRRRACCVLIFGGRGSGGEMNGDKTTCTRD